MSRGLTIFFFLIFCLLSSRIEAQIKLPRLVADSMVLQRNMPLKIWGWASQGEKVSVSFNKRTVSAITGADGKWQVKLPSMKAGGPYEMRLEGKNVIILKGILIGDVWLCAGQSNMVHQMGIHNVRYADDIAKAHYPEIRQFWVPTAASLSGVREDVGKSSWKWANPTSINDFSAVAYFFARDIYTKHHIPIGIINSSYGGTPIEAWTSEDGLKNFHSLMAITAKNKDSSYVKSRQVRSATGLTTSDINPDKGMSEPVKWFDLNYIPKNWHNINVPGYWEDQGVRDLNGVVWYRREIDVPSSMAGKEAKLFLGRIVDADVAFINGKQVGSTSYMYPQRRYIVPAGLLKSGQNLLVVRVQNTAGKGGFVPDKPYFLLAGNEKVDLKGDWQYKVGQAFRPREGRFEPGPIAEQNQPTALFNAMIAPFTDYSIKGVLWYQGESNTGKPEEYKQLLPALISDWRAKFGQPKLPFYYVQLPNFGDASYLPTESSWAVLREASLNSLIIPNTGMAVTIDLGEWNDIHPDNKKDVGERLALIARRFDYGEKKLVYSGPLYHSAVIDGNKIKVNFSNVGGGLISIDGEELSQFSIAAEDRKFVWAKARIVGNTVEVWSDEVKEPRFVRYAWSDNPVDPNLYNAERLPASPFRTDK